MAQLPQGKGGDSLRVYYDLHIHSCLSPCGDSDMTPNNILNMALLAGFDMIALTDHNSCKNCPAIWEAARGSGLAVVPGMELCTAEEAHVVCLFPTLEAALAFDASVRPTLPPVTNRPDIFGEQLILDAEDNITGRMETLLTTASSISVDHVLPLARSFGGTAFPAHIDRPSYSIPAALGDIPPLGFRAMEITRQGDIPTLCGQYAELAGKPLLLDSDAHYLHQIGDPSAWFDLPEKSPEALIAALDGRLPCEWGRE